MNVSGCMLMYVDVCSCMLCMLMYVDVCSCMWMPIWTLSADPMHFAAAFQLDGNAAKVSILFTVPLALQLRTGAAEVCKLQQEAGQE